MAQAPLRPQSKRFSSTQFGLKSLLIATLAVALMLASLRSSSMFWDLLIFNLLMAVLTASLLGAALADRTRPFWLGFAVVGWLHAMLCFGPWLSNYVGPHLFTTVATNYIAAKLEPILRLSPPAVQTPAQGAPRPSGGAGGGFFWPGGLNDGAVETGTGDVLGFQMGGMGGLGGGRASGANTGVDIGVDQYPGGEGAEALPLPRSMYRLQPAGTFRLSDDSLRSNFHRICHYYTTLLVAWLAGITCQILVARRDRCQARENATAAWHT